MSLCEDPVIEIPDSPEPNVTQSQRPVTVAEFEFCLSRVDEKINSLYKLCLRLDKRQQEILKGIKKLVALDELSDGFWKILEYLLKFSKC